MNKETDLADAQRLLAQRDLDSGLMQLALNAAKDQIGVLEEELAQRDAEIERMRSHIRTDNSETLANALARIAELESQQAASVGGEREAGWERGAFDAWFLDEFKRMAPVAGVMMHGVREVYWHGWQARAALSPAGGGVVMPQPLKRGDEGATGEYGAAMIRGFNACLREVARLNAKPQANSQEGE